MGEMRNEFRILVGKHKEKRPLARSRHRWEDNFKIDLRKYYMRAWTEPICLRKEDRWQVVMNTVMNLWVP
jgi:hypothetical protein